MRKKALASLSVVVCVLLVLSVGYWRITSESNESQQISNSELHVTSQLFTTGIKEQSESSVAVTIGTLPFTPQTNKPSPVTPQIQKSSQPAAAGTEGKQSGSSVTAASRTPTTPSQNNGTITVNLTLPLEVLKRKNMPASTIYNMYNRLVVVTSVSSNHFEESKDMIASVQKYLPHSKILFYDLGLTERERLEVRKYCNVELRPVSWDKYPPYAKSLEKYAWKPLIANEVAKEYDLIMYGDSSIRMLSPDIGPVLGSLIEVPFFDIAPAGNKIISYTHDGMISYLKYPPSRKDMVNWGTLQGGAWIMLLNQDMKENVLKPWVDCALHEQCIAPSGSALYTCQNPPIGYFEGKYIGCHRYDQSALNIILAKRFGFNMFNHLTNYDIAGKLWQVTRSSSHNFKPLTCK